MNTVCYIDEGAEKAQIEHCWMHAGNDVTILLSSPPVTQEDTCGDMFTAFFTPIADVLLEFDEGCDSSCYFPLLCVVLGRI